MPSASRAAVVYNPVKVDGDELRRAIAAESAAADWGETLWYETSVEDPGGGQAKAALEAGADMVIAAGGDGTIRAVAEVLGGTSTSLALLPSGTGNLLARNLDLTLDDLENSIHVAFAGADRRIDLAWAELRREDGSTERAAYLVMAGFGLDAKMLSNTDEELKAKMGWLAYVAAIRTALRDKNRMRMRYRLDRHRIRALSAHTLIIGNCGSLPANILLLPTAAIDDGRFEAVFLRPESAWGWMQIMGKVIWENGVLRRTRWGRKLVGRDVDALRYVKGRRLEVVLSRAEEIELDGDGFGRARALRTWIDAGGLTVRVPPSEQEPSPERAAPRERRETQPDKPPTADELPGDADETAVPGGVDGEALPAETGAIALPGEVLADETVPEDVPLDEALAEETQTDSSAPDAPDAAPAESDPPGSST